MTLTNKRSGYLLKCLINRGVRVAVLLGFHIKQMSPRSINVMIIISNFVV